MTLSEQIEATKLTIAELEAVMIILDEVVRIGIPDDAPLAGALKTAAAKMRWYIAACPRLATGATGVALTKARWYLAAAQYRSAERGMRGLRL
jgi:hypothetical protein